MTDHLGCTHNSCEIKPKKKKGFNRIRTHDLCDTGAVLYQLSYQANWELVRLWVHNIPVDGEKYIVMQCFRVVNTMVIPQVTWIFLVFTQAFRKYIDQHSQCNICAVHDGKVGCNTVKYTMVFLYSDWLYFLWHGIKVNIYEQSYIWTAEKDMSKTWLIITVISLSHLNFFQALISQLLKLCV